jgi:F0F1-type ATP synthase membrane subunit b/b'
LNDLLDFASKLSAAPFAAILLFVIFIIIITSRRGDWVWKRELVALEARNAELKSELEEWKTLALARREDVENAVIDLARRRRP